MLAPRTWTHANEVSQPSLIRLTEDALCLAKVPTAELRLDLPLDSIASQRIPLRAVTFVETEEYGPTVNVTHRQGEKNAETVAVTFDDVVQRDEFLEALLGFLGPDWERVVFRQGPWQAAKWPLVATLIITVVTAFAHHEAEQMAAGAKLKAGGPGRLRLLRAALHWLEEQLGPTGVIVLGGVLIALCLVWLCYGVANPMVFIRLRPASPT